MRPVSRGRQKDTKAFLQCEDHRPRLYAFQVQVIVSPLEGKLIAAFQFAKAPICLTVLCWQKPQEPREPCGWLVLCFIYCFNILRGTFLPCTISVITTADDAELLV